ncbi:MAG: thioesterase family protein [Pseudomonadota bacterium]
MQDSQSHPGRFPGLVPCFQGSVNQWECDENDHLNVRFYAHKINQALQIYLAGLGAEQPSEALPRIRAQHIRFLKESRSATPLRVDCGMVGRDAERLELLAVMHDNVDGEPLAAFTTTLDLTRWPIAPSGDLVAPPEHARPRGLDPAALPGPPASPEAARAAGFRVVGRGIISAEECAGDGRLLPHVYIGRISDAMPNLWAFMASARDAADRDTGTMGGAALEQRLTIHAPLREGAVFCQLSGVRALGNKTQQMAHLLYDETAGRFAASAEAVGVAMDLTTRKAVPISPERRARMESLLLRDG